MTYIIGIDPGPTQSGVVVYQPNVYKVQYADVVENENVHLRLTTLPLWTVASTEYAQIVLAIEFPCFYGKSVSIGRDVLETAAMVGWLEAEVMRGYSRKRVRITRRQVRMHLCGTMRSGDAQVWQALLDRYGGRSTAIGNKKNPGPLYGVKSHARAALAVAITAAEMQQ